MLGTEVGISAKSIFRDIVCFECYKNFAIIFCQPVKAVFFLWVKLRLYKNRAKSALCSAGFVTQAWTYTQLVCRCANIFGHSLIGQWLLYGISIFSIHRIVVL